MTAPDPAVAEAMALLDGIGPEEVLLWSGAGISVEGPTSLPSGPELTSRVFDTFFEPGALARVLTYHQVVGLTTTPLCERDTGLPAARLPRLETALDAAARARPDAFPDTFDILDDVRVAVPNRLHAFAADHIARGGRHVTANFDTCVERAHEARHGRPVPPDAVHHFHLSFADSPDGKELGATLSAIRTGFPAAEATRMRALLRSPRAVIVLGYSGSDYFDVDRLVAALPADDLRGLRVLWALHSAHPPHLPDVPAESAIPLQSLLRTAGADVRVVCGPTDLLLAELARRWGLPPPDAPRPRTPAAPRLTVTDAERHRATFLLYRSLGLHREVRRLLEEGGTGADDPVELRSVRSQLLWEAGAWSSLRRMWRRAPADAPDRSVRAERIGACLWAQGRLLAAWLWLRRQRSGVAEGSDEAYALEETLNRVVEHMHRTPDLRPLARRLLARMPAAPEPAGTPPAQETGEMQETPDTRAAEAARDDNRLRRVAAFRALQDVRDSLDALRRGGPRDDHTHADRSTTWFRESGDLQGMLSYRHRALRDGYRADDAAVTDEALRERYEQLLTANLFLGSRAGAWRVALLPGAHRVFAVREYLFALATLQYGWWHRFRLLAWYLPRRLRHRAAGAGRRTLLGRSTR
ncbi:hypothetical protein JCM4814A_08410 [Streptomyces phaeofaciens JCM 4814]|uniref:SIR2-like domain-containing protein n=1 Tax=Streptomyces phaeofaciens TaxID=68254 RepID=A0A918HJR7_9ACTN|nr:hypothetical protein [Streptomyces phaeofaciens]GGT66410.1 hypothetical protein GCM10010226_50300 [Streptomyces phaeofaciens]